MPTITVESGNVRIPMKTWQDDAGLFHMTVDWENVPSDHVIDAKRIEIHFARMHDDNGNPPPALLQGDMIPKWYAGQWWVDWSAYARRCAENGDLP